MSLTGDHALQNSCTANDIVKTSPHLSLAQAEMQRSQVRRQGKNSKGNVMVSSQPAKHLCQRLMSNQSASKVDSLQWIVSMMCPRHGLQS